MSVNMPTRLNRPGAGVFSEIALFDRAGPGAHDAGWRRRERATRSMPGRRFPDQPTKRTGERADAVIPHLDRDRSDGVVRSTQQPLRPFDPSTIEVLVRCLTEGHLESAYDVRRRQVSHPREPFKVQRLGIVPIYGVAYPQHQTGRRLGGHVATVVALQARASAAVPLVTTPPPATQLPRKRTASTNTEPVIDLSVGHRSR